jgi:hypothetical protein
MCHPFPHFLMNSIYSTPWCVLWVCIHVFCLVYVRCLPKSAYALHIHPLLLKKNSTCLCQACKNFNYTYIPMLFFTTYAFSCGNWYNTMNIIIVYLSYFIMFSIYWCVYSLMMVGGSWDIGGIGKLYCYVKCMCKFWLFFFKQLLCNICPIMSDYTNDW